MKPPVEQDVQFAEDREEDPGGLVSLPIIFMEDNRDGPGLDKLWEDDHLVEGKGVAFDYYIFLTVHDRGPFNSSIFLSSGSRDGKTIRIIAMGDHCGWHPFTAAIIMTFQKTGLACPRGTSRIRACYSADETSIEVFFAGSHGVGHYSFSPKLLTSSWSFSFVWAHRLSRRILSLDRVSRRYTRE